MPPSVFWSQGCCPWVRWQAAPWEKGWGYGMRSFWLQLAAYPYLPTWQALTLETASTIFREIIRPKCAIWVGTLDRRIVAYLAMQGSYIDRLYVDPSEWRKG